MGARCMARKTEVLVFDRLPYHCVFQYHWFVIHFLQMKRRLEAISPAQRTLQAFFRPADSCNTTAASPSAKLATATKNDTKLPQATVPAKSASPALAPKSESPAKLTEKPKSVPKLSFDSPLDNLTPRYLFSSPGRSD